MNEVTRADGWKQTAEWPDPTPETLTDPRFEAIWQCIKSWDINVPTAYAGYMGATGNHVRAILYALDAAALSREGEIPSAPLKALVEEWRERRRYLVDHAHHEPMAAEQAHVYNRCADELSALLSPSSASETGTTR